MHETSSPDKRFVGWTSLAYKGDTTGINFGNNVLVAIPLALSSPSDVEQTVDALADVLEGTYKHNKLVWEERRNLAAIKNDEPTMFLLEHTGVAAGWAGWLPYQEETPGYQVWQSSTYLARHLRGVGILKYTSCLQYHLRSHMLNNNNSSNGESEKQQLRFISSIEDNNVSSVNARSTYAKLVGWNRPHAVYEKVRQRNAVLWQWSPEHKVCFLGDGHLGVLEKHAVSFC